MVFMIFNTPILPFDLGVSSVHIYLIFVAIAFMYTFVLDTNKDIKIGSSLIVVVIFTFLLILILGRNNEIIDFANQSIPPEWAELYAKKEYDDFYRSTKIAIFQLINFLFMVIFFIFSNKNKIPFDEQLKKILIATLITQMVVVLIQKFILGEHRPVGTLGNSQSVGFLLSVIACYIFFYCTGFDKKILFLAVIITSIITGTRSVIAILAVLWVLDIRYLREHFNRIIPLSIFCISFLFTIFVSYSETFKDTVIIGINYITSPLSMHIRFLMWGSFMDVVLESPLFGTYGIPTYFTDNAYWNFILPYGFFGLIFVTVFFGSMIYFSNRNKIFYYLSIVYSIQSISYSGAFQSNLAMGMILLLGYEYSKLKRIK